MVKNKAAQLSIVVPVYNEGAGLAVFHQSLIETLNALGHDYEIIYCDDGSIDDSAALVQQWHQADQRVKLIKLSRNFGKESALAAGIAAASGAAIITLDGDGQHPVELLPQFVAAWQKGARVVVGIRSNRGAEPQLGSRLFYQLFNKLTHQKLIPGSTDYRLIDASVQQAFLELKETDRITRGLIDWLGFERTFIHFTAKPRQTGAAGYDRGKRWQLAANSFVSLTPTPLYLFGYLGVFITGGALLLGGAVFIEQLLLADPLHWKFTGTAMLGILILFLVGMVLMSQGILSLYISHMHTQSKQRPLYVVDYQGSAGIEKPAQHV